MRSLSSNGSYGGKLEGIAGYVPTQRLEWKRYKQYTRSDIMAAIEEVKKGRRLDNYSCVYCFSLQ